MMFGIIKNLISSTPRGPKIMVENMALYYYPSCPFCRTVLSQVKRLNLDLELRNIHQLDQHKADLIAGGGRKTVPCLRIDKTEGDTQWMYESMDIIDFLKSKFSAPA